MKKNFIILMMLAIVATFFAGCSKEEKLEQEAIKDLNDLTTAQQKLVEGTETLDPNDPAYTAKMMENYAQYGAQIDLQEFEKAESVDAPSDFPSELIYKSGKITESSENSSDSYIDKNITIRTTDGVKAVKDFYKNLFTQPGWQITSQSSASDGASYSATDSAAIGVSVDITYSPYSKIVDVYVRYSGEISS